MNGGYDSGYSSCPCFWGRDPGKLVRHLANIVPSFTGLQILDAGCGEGKNSAFLSACGAAVRAVDISELAISHAKTLWSPSLKIDWRVDDLSKMEFQPDTYDVIVAYGLFHCLRSAEVIRGVIGALKQATKQGGYHTVAVLNSRSQDLRAHPELSPCLLDHDNYLRLYNDWRIVIEEDTDLTETHPHNKIPHTHSITRILVQKAAR